MTTRTMPQTRRAVLAAAVGAAGGAVAASLGRPLAVDATVAAMQTGMDNESDAATRLIRSNVGIVLGVTTGTMPAYELGGEVVSIGTDQFGWPALNVVSTGEAGVAIQATASGETARGIVVTAPQDGVRAEQQNEFGAGVYGIAHGSEAAGVAGLGTGYGTAGVAGVSEGVDGTAVRGHAIGPGTGGAFASDSGTALDVRGKAKFSRSGKATIVAGRSSVKVPLAGVTTSSLVFAVMRSNRSGIYVRAVAPATGSFTIYLNKAVASTSYLSYFVVN